MRTIAFAAVAAVLFLGARPQPALGQAAAERPTLVVVFTIDQLRPDYLERWAHQLDGGLARLTREGAYFPNGVQDHAITETAPGHASVLSGRFPRSTGILTNAAGVQDPQYPVIGGGAAGASPFRFRGGALFDWMRSADPRSRALSASRKDRGAILPIGRADQEVYWYSPTGWMTSSTYYADTLPTWVQRFNARGIPQSMAGKAWTRLLDPRAYPEPDTVPTENQRVPGGSWFPHVLPVEQAAGHFASTPWMDELTLDFVLEGIRTLGLGIGPQPDLVAVSLSSTDAIGHNFGPDSEELHDQVLRLDRLLGEFLDRLFEMRDPGTVAIALTSDHGVAPFPELHDPERGRSMYVDLRDLEAAAHETLAAAGVNPLAFELDNAMILVDREAIAAGGLDPEGLVADFARGARRRAGVLRVDRVADLAQADTATDAIARRWLHALSPDLPAELVITLEPYHIWGPIDYATHGSPHEYDARVPIAFYGPAFRAGVYEAAARTVDIGPTLARVLGVVPTEPDLDGHALDAALDLQPAAAGR